MIKAVFYTRDERYIGFTVKGHAGFAAAGKDIVCSAVSALVLNTINSIDELTEDKYILDTCEGVMKFRLIKPFSRESENFVKALRIGLCNIYAEYGDAYIKIFFKEV